MKLRLFGGRQDADPDEIAASLQKLRQMIEELQRRMDKVQAEQKSIQERVGKDGRVGALVDRLRRRLEVFGQASKGVDYLGHGWYYGEIDTSRLPQPVVDLRTAQAALERMQRSFEKIVYHLTREEPENAAIAIERAEEYVVKASRRAWTPGQKKERLADIELGMGSIEVGMKYLRKNFEFVEEDFKLIEHAILVVSGTKNHIRRHRQLWENEEVNRGLGAEDGRRMFVDQYRRTMPEVLTVLDELLRVLHMCAEDEQFIYVTSIKMQKKEQEAGQELEHIKELLTQSEE